MKTAEAIRDLYDRVEEIRGRESLSWGDVSRASSVPQATLTRFIAGEATLSLKNYLLLSDFTEQWKDYSPEQRDKMAESGEAMPDGSYPIADCEDLKNAIQAVGRAKDIDATKAHIKKRAAALDCDVDLPEDWAGGVVTMDEPVTEFTVIGDYDLPVADREVDWDGGAAKARIFELYTDSEGNVDTEQVEKAFLRKDPNGDPDLKGTYALGFADVIGGTLMMVPSGVAAVAGGHGIGQLEGISVDELQQLKNACCNLYVKVSQKYEDWPACPFQRDDRNEKQVDIDDDAPIKAAGSVGALAVEGVIAIEGAPTGDGRMLERESVKWDEDILPVPLIWDRDEGDHSGMTVGSIVKVWRDGGEIWASGFLSASEDPQTRAAVARVAELFDEGAVGVSIALDDVDTELRVKHALVAEAEASEEDIEAILDGDPDDDGRVVVAKASTSDVLDVTTSGLLRHVAVVDTAAIAKAKLRLVGERNEEVVEIAASGSLRIVEFEVDAEAFADPKFGAPGNDPRLLFDPHNNRWSCPVTVDDTGRVFGHIAPWGICLRGRPDRCITPPNADLGGFMRGAAPLAGGLRTGTIMVSGSHCSTGVGAEAATRHYDKTGRAVADVRVGVDAYGVWFAGRLRPGASNEDIYAFKSSDVSGHWEVGKGGQMTLCGLPAVNVGGFPKGYLTAEEVATAASAALAADDCGCEEVEILESDLIGFDAERFARLEAAIERISVAVAPLYAEHLAKSVGEDTD